MAQRFEGKDSRTADFSRRKNPYTLPSGRQHLRERIIFCLLFFSTIGFCALMLFHPFFYISKIEIEGAKRLDKTAIEQTTKNSIYQKRWIFPGESYLLAGEERIQTALAEVYTGERIRVTKQFPDTVRILIEEKQPAILYDSGKEYMLLGEDGTFIERVRAISEAEWQTVPVTPATTSTPSSTVEIQTKRVHVPAYREFVSSSPGAVLVYNPFQQEESSSVKYGTSILSTERATGLVAWYRLLVHKLSLTPRYIELLDAQARTAQIVLVDGWSIFINLREPAEQGEVRLETLLRHEAIDKHPGMYVDLRYAERVFWR